MEEQTTNEMIANALAEVTALRAMVNALVAQLSAEEKTSLRATYHVELEKQLDAFKRKWKVDLPSLEEMIGPEK